MSKNKLITSGLSVAMLLSAAPVSTFATVSKPAKVKILKLEQTNGVAKVTWKKLKKTPSGYAVYQKKGSSSWKLLKRVSKKTTSASTSIDISENNSFKIRAYKAYKVKKYYNKKTKKYVSKKAYNKLAKKNRSIKKVTAYKYGKYSDILTLKGKVAEKKTDENKADESKTDESQKTEEKVDITMPTITATGRIHARDSLDESEKSFYIGDFAISNAVKSVSGATNLKYILERSIDGGAYEVVATQDASNVSTLGKLIIVDNDVESHLEVIDSNADGGIHVPTFDYKIYAEATVNGETVQSNVVTFHFEPR